MNSSKPEPAFIRKLLEKIGASISFERKDVQGKILRFVVEETIAGRELSINEDMIGVKVLGFSQDYDKVLNSSVRAHVGRLRQTLVEYYQSDGRGDHLQIIIPKGGYVPYFVAPDGLQSVSTGLRRDESFRKVREKATERIIIVGTGMTRLSQNAKATLIDHARIVPIDIFMTDPKFLENSPPIGQMVDEFFDIDDFSLLVKHSFNALKKLAEEWNRDKHNRHHISLSVYTTVPNFSMTMIDPALPSGEAVIEFYMYKCGEYRPRLHVTNTTDPNCFFMRFHTVFEKLSASARKIV